MTVPVGELVAQIRRDRERLPDHVRRGRAMPEWQRQLNLLWILDGLAEDAPMPLLFDGRGWLVAWTMPCHDHQC